MRAIYLFFTLLFFSCSLFDSSSLEATFSQSMTSSVGEILAKNLDSIVHLEITLKDRKHKPKTIYANGCFIDKQAHILTIPLLEDKIVSINTWYKGKKYQTHLVKQYNDLGYSIVRFIASQETKPVEFGDTSVLKRGQSIYGIVASGSYLNFEPIVNVGTISAIIPQRIDIILHNGFSLYTRKGYSTLNMVVVNSKGEVVGFATNRFIVTNDDALLVKEKFLSKTKSSNKAWIGVIFDVISPDEVEALGYPPTGLKIKRVYYDSPAGKAGVRAGDILIGMNQRFFSRKQRAVFSQFRRWSNPKVGQKLQLHLLRDNRKINFMVTYAKKPTRVTTKIDELGLEVRDIRSLEYYGYSLLVKSGVLVTKVLTGSPFEGAYFENDSINRGDVIVEIEGEKISSVASLSKILETIAERQKKLISIKFLSGHFSSYVVVKPNFLKE